MRLYGVLILFLSFSAACGLRCYTCVGAEPNSCTNIMTCPAVTNRCSSVKTGDLVTKTCMLSAGCTGPISCCEGDLCNSAVPTGPGVTLLLLSSALMMLFI
ncbi:lymphocyte antigen 6G-like [Poecilia reticulata]|uniref:Lymphocyte antigen 6G-like n=1 Tax=Poecilia reticulata TaxID=8081 RepID=A0A3P9P951_POERE|nr:PREDICTED: lymphocyte antigen 6G-like [Poecilia reticulata]